MGGFVIVVLAMELCVGAVVGGCSRSCAGGIPGFEIVVLVFVIGGCCLRCCCCFGRGAGVEGLGCGLWGRRSGGFHRFKFLVPGVIGGPPPEACRARLVGGRLVRMYSSTHDFKQLFFVND